MTEPPEFFGQRSRAAPDLATYRRLSESLAGSWD